MKYSMILLTVLLSCAHSVLADPIYQCEGETGEASYSERPCGSLRTDTSTTTRARYAAHDARLEQVKSEKVALKRQLMDIKREYYYSVGRIPADEEPALTAQYEQLKISLHAEIQRLDEMQTRLVGQSFDDVLQTNAGR